MTVLIPYQRRGTVDTKHALKAILFFGGIAATGLMVLMLYASLRAAPPSQTVFQRARERARK
ncbi:MAG: hypothetical protein HYY92_00560 [Parcubacteria group bacterium]|nr:hypothetical protein [Parcubacteria group bacterium]